jgi:NTP pyrophosphatase (non-canonical NTP hydrolase)
MLDKLLELNKRRMDRLFEDNENRYTGARMYVTEMRQEIDEMEEQLKTNNVVYLEDELGDILRDYLCLLRGLEHE